MRLEPQNRRRAVRVIPWLAVAVATGFWWNCLPPPPDSWILNLANNPDKFFLWGATNHFDYTFTYDPHAADEWRFEHGVFPVSAFPGTNGEFSR